jgi:hypothetical protein
MAEPRTYKTAAAFRAALEQRMVVEARTSARPIDFVRKRISFERFLARIFTQSDVSWALKGGYRLELSLHRSRTTKDVDLVLSDMTLLSSGPEQQSNAMLDLLQTAAGLDLGDYFSFQISLRELMGHATVGGARFTVRVLIAGREFDTFRLDVGLAETQKTRLIPLRGQNWLSFAGIDSPTVYAINDEYQFAEKLHAYTYPWENTENSRSKDLLDLRMLSDRITNFAELKDAIEDIFAVRGKQPIPDAIKTPPASWRNGFDDQARQYGYEGSMEDCHQQLEEYYKRLLKSD